MTTAVRHLDSITAWARRLVRRHPEVEAVRLVGSRVIGAERPDSDWDVLVAIDAALYAGARWASAERRVAFDRSLAWPEPAALELWFLRPDGELGRWDYPPGQLPADLGAYLAECARAGCPPGDFSRFYREWLRPDSPGVELWPVAGPHEVPA